MTGDNAKANAQDEIQHGNEALEAARCLLANGFFRDAVSRTYYAAYHWARAVLFTKGLEAKTHHGTIQLLTLHFVKDGSLSVEAGKLLGDLEIHRELSDYTSAAQFTEAEAAGKIADAERFIDACRPLVEKE